MYSFDYLIGGKDFHKIIFDDIHIIIIDNIHFLCIFQVMDGILSLIEGDDSSKEKALAHVVQAWQTPEVRLSLSLIFN